MNHLLEEYSHSYSLTAADMDTDYRMTPNAVLLYYQDCWARYMACLHLAAFDVVKQNLLWVITEFNAFFEEETAFWSDEINVTVWNSEISTLRLFADFAITKKDGTPLAHGHGCWTLLDTQAHKLAANTPLATQIPLKESTSHHKLRFPKEETLLREIEHKVNPINLDFNGHVNNRTYLSIAMQTAANGFAEKTQVCELAIRWLRETFLGDTLTCRLYAVDTHQYINAISKADGTVVAQIYALIKPRDPANTTTVADVAPRD